MLMFTVQLWFGPSAHHFVATPAPARTKTGQGTLLKQSCHLLYTHQHWLKTCFGCEIRSVCAITVHFKSWLFYCMNITGVLSVR